MPLSPKLLLARPVASNYRRPLIAGTEGSTSSKANSISATYSGLHHARGHKAASVATSNSIARSFLSRAVSIFSGEGGNNYSFGGFGQPHSKGEANRRFFFNFDDIPLPRAPTIPFTSITNSLQLYLNFKVFESDSERILAWIPGSIVEQLPIYLDKVPSYLRRRKKFMPSLANKTPDDIDSFHADEKPCYILLTDRSFYIFDTLFAMPHDPFSQDAPSAEVLAAAMAQAVSSQLVETLGQVCIVPIKNVFLIFLIKFVGTI